MTFRIPRGRHRARPLRFGFWWRRNSFTRVVKFTDSCRYDLGNDDQLDTNKLCGIGYLSRPRFVKTKLFNRFWFWKLQPMHWGDSARFGWRYDTAKDMVELIAYCYVNSQRVIKSICFCTIGNEYRIRLQVLALSYYFDVYEPDSLTAAGIVTVERNHNKHFKYRLGFWFGGQARAPHDMIIELKQG